MNVLHRGKVLREKRAQSESIDSRFNYLFIALLKNELMKPSSLFFPVLLQ